MFWCLLHKCAALHWLLHIQNLKSLIEGTVKNLPPPGYVGIIEKF